MITKHSTTSAIFLSFAAFAALAACGGVSDAGDDASPSARDGSVVSSATDSDGKDYSRVGFLTVYADAVCTPGQLATQLWDSCNGDVLTEWFTTADDGRSCAGWDFVAVRCSDVKTCTPGLVPTCSGGACFCFLPPDGGVPPPPS
jgi:hypothetical protein